MTRIYAKRLVSEESAGMPAPLLVLGAGRSGTTMTVRLLASHPEVVAHMVYPCECRLLTLQSYPDHPMAGIPQGPGNYLFEGGIDVLRMRSAQGDRFGPDSVRVVYRELGERLGKRARYFVEKLFAHIDIAPILSSFPEARIVQLLRDPRDVLLSARALNRRRGFHGFLEKEGDTDEQIVLKYRDLFTAMAESAAKANFATTVRYEDLIRAPAPTLSALLEWLNLPSADAVVQTMLAGARLTELQHRTSTSDAESLGRWRREMPLSLNALYETHFGDLLRRLGYP